MNLTEGVRILRRRWLVLVPILVVGVIMSVVVFRATPTEFEATAQLVLLAPIETPGQQQDGPINPFLNFGGSQDTAAQVLGVRMGDAGVTKLLDEAGVGSEWKFEIQATAGPLALVTVSERTSAQAIDSASAIVMEAQNQFTKIQLESGSPESQLVRLTEVSSPGDPKELYSKKVRNAAAVGTLFLLLAVATAFSVEGISRSRARRRPPAPTFAAPALKQPASWAKEPTRDSGPAQKPANDAPLPPDDRTAVDIEAIDESPMASP